MPSAKQRGLTKPKAYEPPKDLLELSQRTAAWVAGEELYLPKHASTAWVFGHYDMYSAPLEVDRELNEY